jgi:capsular exopolysaccharide synthesis family protein
MDDAARHDHYSVAPRSGGGSLLHVLWQHRALVLFALVAGVAIGALTYSQRSPIYRATTQILVVKKQDSNVLPVAGGDPRMAVMEDYVATHLLVIRSPLIVGMAVKKRNLEELKSLQGNAISVIQKGLVATRESSRDNPTGGNGVLTLSYSGSNPDDVEVILAAIIESYKDFLDETYQNTSLQTVELIKTAAETLNKNLAQKEEEYRNFLKNNPVLIVSDNGVPYHQGKVLEYKKKETESRDQVAAIQKRFEVVEKAIQENQSPEIIIALAEQKYEKDALAQNDKAPSRKDNAAAMETALTALVMQESELLQFYGPDHPEVERVRQRIIATRDLHRRLDEIARDEKTGSKTADPIQKRLQGMRVELELAAANHKWIKGVLDDELAKARELETFYHRDRGFREDIGRTQKVLDTTLKRLEEITLVSGHGGFDRKVITPPGRGVKTSPVLWQFLVLGALVGVVLGLSAAYVLDLTDKSFRNPEEIRRRLGLPIAGHLPYFSSRAESVSAVDSQGNPVELDSRLMTFHNPKSAAAEGVRGIRTVLFFSAHANGHKVIQVTSPNMGDGKTTLITNLAISIAQSGRKVLLIDADLRRPRIHRAFGLAGRVGLAEVIAGTADLDEAIQVTVLQNLSILPCGQRPQNPAELLTSPRLDELIHQVRNAFDFVLIDTPPLLAVSDPCIVAPRADSLILTLRPSKHGRPAAERARDILNGIKVNCMGLVVNGVGKTGLGYGYGSSYEYRYGGEYASEYYTSDADGQGDRAPDDQMPFAEEEAAASTLSLPFAEEIVEGYDTSRSAKPRSADHRRPSAGGRAAPSTNGHSEAPNAGR